MRPTAAGDFDPKAGAPRWVGAGVVLGLHVLVGWALVSGLARKAIEAVRQPIEVAILDEVKAPPPPPPPPPPPEPPKVVKLKDAPIPPPPAAPKTYVPPPEVTPAPTPPAPAVQAVQAEPPPKQVEIRPPPPPAPPAPPAPPSPPAPPAPPAPAPRAEVGLACPGYADILRNTLEGAFDRYGIAGVVRVRMLVRGSQVVEVTPLSGPREYHRLVTQAARRFRCQASGADEVQVTFEVSFREE